MPPKRRSRKRSSDIRMETIITDPNAYDERQINIQRKIKQHEPIDLTIEEK